jgi:hypothetical protein
MHVHVENTGMYIFGITSKSKNLLQLHYKGGKKMKRVKYACLEQTLHFMLKEDGISHDAAVRTVKEEVADYKKQLEQSRTKYRIVGEIVESDESVVLKIKKQYAGYECGDYLK